MWPNDRHSTFVAPKTPTPNVLTVLIIKTAADLWHAMGMTNPMILIQGRVGLLQSVQRENGSGKAFNVTLMPVQSDVMQSVFIRF